MAVWNRSADRSVLGAEYTRCALGFVRGDSGGTPANARSSLVNNIKYDYDDDVAVRRRETSVWSVHKGFSNRFLERTTIFDQTIPYN